MNIDPICHQHYFVITGGPGVGKTTMLEELKNRGFICIPEVAREIIREQILTDGEALPWKNTEAYKEWMLNRSVESYQMVDNSNKKYTFFDRGIIDTLCYARL